VRLPPNSGVKQRTCMRPDPWLNRWVPLIRQHAAGSPVLEIGCGSGADAASVVAAGMDVIAFDLSANAVDKARAFVPTAKFLVRDVRESFPAEVQGTGVIIASLSLHYFAWAETVALFGRVRQTLRSGGLFLCRLNSTQDTNFGAEGHPEIEPNYYLVEGAPKRFFDQASVDALLSPGWQILSMQHMLTGKYIKQKALWELVCTKSTV
jgi:SAM-dependent methyltransferase